MMSLILNFEWVILAIIGAAFFFPSPIRDSWLWLLALLPVILIVRFIVARRIYTRTPLDLLLVAFFALGILNIVAAPYTRGIIMLGRPLFGLAIFTVLAEQARRHGKLDTLLWITVGLGGLVGIIALTMSQWTSKSDQLILLINMIPVIRGMPGAEGGFNVNEIAGGLSWLTPVMAAAALYYWPRRLPTVFFGFLILALFLGQSRLALFGTLTGQVVIIVTLIKSKRKRLIGWAVLGMACLLEIAIISNVFLPSNRESALNRDDSSLTLRVGIWQSGISIIQDHPLTGIGMDRFRYGPVREQYPAPGYESRILPHAHNEWIGIGTDLGIPGIIVFGGWYVVAGYMLVYGYRHGDAAARTVAAGVAAGLLAHAVYAIGDAIPLWDRLSFIFWWLLGLAAAQYVHVRYSLRQSGA
ncbi:MAG: O-antigen ligase family protein [Anaerolineaceae bacterium]|nr:O-antigen ligase family protein [Anaerolineaceae bacterium]